MVKIFSICLVKIDVKPSVILAAEYELSSFGYFQRSSIQEFMTFFSKTLAERTPNPGSRQSVEQDGIIFNLENLIC